MLIVRAPVAPASNSVPSDRPNAQYFLKVSQKRPARVLLWFAGAPERQGQLDRAAHGAVRRAALRAEGAAPTEEEIARYLVDAVALTVPLGVAWPCDALTVRGSLGSYYGGEQSFDDAAERIDAMAHAEWIRRGRSVRIEVTS